MARQAGSSKPEYLPGDSHLSLPKPLDNVDSHVLKTGGSAGDQRCPVPGDWVGVGMALVCQSDMRLCTTWQIGVYIGDDKKENQGNLT